MSRFEGCKLLTTWPPMRISPEVIDLEARDRVQQRRLAASGRAHEDEKAALLKRDIDALEDLERAKFLAKGTNFKRRHRFILSQRQP